VSITTVSQKRSEELSTSLYKMQGMNRLPLLLVYKHATQNKFNFRKETLKYESRFFVYKENTSQ